MPLYKHPTVRGFPVWFTPDDEDLDLQEKMGTAKEQAMITAGKWPTKEYLATLPENERLHVSGNASAIVTEFVENTFFQPVGQWTTDHPQYRAYNILSESDGFRVLIDFVTRDGQQAFLAKFPKWTITKPKMWWDIPGIKTAKARWGRNEKYDLLFGKRE